MFALCWRQVSKSKRTVLNLFIYITVYLIISYAIAPKPMVIFLSDEFRVGDKYAFLYLDLSKTPVFTDAEGANVFESRQCGRCFITNNVGFLPMAEYDAVLVLGDENTETLTAQERERRYSIETSRECIRKKFKGCDEPKIKSLSSMEIYDLCRLCDSLQMKRRPEE